MAIINLSAANTLRINQTESVPIKPRRVISILVVTQAVHINKIVEGVESPLVIVQSAVPALNLHISVQSVLAPQQVAPPRTKYLAANNVLVLTQVGASVNLQYTLNVLNLTQNAQPSRALFGSLVLSQIAHPTLTVSLSGTQSLTLVSTATYFITDASRGFNIPVPDTILPTGITYACGALILRLKAPELGNGDRIEFLRIQRETRGGDLEVYSDPVWPKIETLIWTFKNLKRADSINVLAFLEQTVGQTITLLDYEGNTWTGIISTPAPDVKCTSDKNCGSYEVTIEFQGLLE